MSSQQSVFAFKGKMLDLKTGIVKKESQQSSARMGMGARRSFICRMRCDSYYIVILSLSDSSFIPVCIYASMHNSSIFCSGYICRCGTCPVEPLSMNRLNFLRNRNRWYFFFPSCFIEGTRVRIYHYNFLLHVRNGLGAAKDGEPQYVVVHCTGYIKAWPPAGKTINS